MTVSRTLLFLGLLILIIRLMGKRQVGQMEPAEFAVALLIADLAAIPIENPHRTVLSGLLPMAVVLAVERLLSLVSFRSIRLRRILCGKPVILIENGRPMLKNLRRTRVNLDELTAQIRQKGILELSQVQYAILETSGAMTVFPFPQVQPPSAKDAGVEASAQELPYTVLSRGHLVEENLLAVGKTVPWLEEYLADRGCTRQEVLLLTVTPGGKTGLILLRDC